MGEARKVGNSHETYDFVAHDRVLYVFQIARSVLLSCGKNDMCYILDDWSRKK